MSPMQSDHAAKVMAFLERHRLPPSPQNYTLAYIALNDAGSPMGRAVEAIIAEGYRIKQDEADEIFDRHGGIAIFGSQERNDGELTAHLRHQAIKLGELASSAADATGAFARELSEEAGAFSGDSGNTLSIVTRMIEQSLDTQTRLTAAMDEVKALREELEAARHDAQRDELTGLANRRAIDGYLGELAAKGEPRIIALCDIDHFKSVNDRYGHAAGDRVLTAFADVVAEAVRSRDVIGRLGGEEFAIVLSGVTEAHAKQVAERIVEAVEAGRLPEDGQSIGVTVSIGVAHSTRRPTSRFEDLLAVADEALYRAKKAGRNRAIMA